MPLGLGNQVYPVQSDSNYGELYPGWEADGADGAVEQASRSVRTKSRASPLRPVKDSIDTAGVPTHRGLPNFRFRLPEEDAVALARMKATGSISFAMPNLPE
ncbi:hypothetical protein GGR57DRAFT_465844 [Xylariaceae sp. FL1272]|nr:hypothetical protein GGR57DRAFT_465844 [Xylariaceae sp. FL1272]